MSLLSLVITLFLIANPIGCAPALLALVKDFDPARQKKILLREGIFSLIIALGFLYVGGAFLQTLHIEEYSLKISGGTLLFLVAMYMVFPHASSGSGTSMKQEPFIVPIATPLISGGGIFTTIVMYSQQLQNYTLMTEAIILAWIVIIGIMYCSSYLQKLLGKSGLAALEQVMGMILMMIAVEIVKGGVYKLLQAMSHN